MKLSVEYNSQSNIGTIRHEGIDIQSEADVQKWRGMVFGELARAIPKGRKAWLLVDFSGFNVGKDMVERYGEVAMEVRAPFSKGGQGDFHCRMLSCQSEHTYDNSSKPVRKGFTLLNKIFNICFC